MKTRKKLLITLIGLVMFIFIIAYYHGFFLSMNVVEKRDGGYVLAGLEFKGPYSEAGTHMDEVEQQLKKQGIFSERGFGVYYDNPENVKPENCRSFLGVILEKNDVSKAPILKSVGLKLDSVPVGNSLQVSFPIRNSFSYMIGPKKAYPALSRYLKEKNYEPDLTMEIYNTRSREIIFLIQYH